MANENIDRPEKIYKQARERFNHTMLIFEQTFEEILQALRLNKISTKDANEIAGYMLAVKRSLLAVKFELDTLEDNQPTQEDK